MERKESYKKGPSMVLWYLFVFSKLLKSNLTDWKMKFTLFLSLLLFVPFTEAEATDRHDLLSTSVENPSPNTTNTTTSPNMEDTTTPTTTTVTTTPPTTTVTTTLSTTTVTTTPSSPMVKDGEKRCFEVCAARRTSTSSSTVRSEEWSTLSTMQDDMKECIRLCIDDMIRSTEEQRAPPSTTTEHPKILSDTSESSSSSSPTSSESSSPTSSESSSSSSSSSSTRSLDIDTISSHIKRPGDKKSFEVNYNCMMCICEASSDKDECEGRRVPMDPECFKEGVTQPADMKWRCGPYQLTPEYWEDCGKLGGTFLNCTRSTVCSQYCAAVYLIKNHMEELKEATHRDPPLCSDFARLHRDGIDKIDSEESVSFSRQVDKCCKGMSEGQC